MRKTLRVAKRFFMLYRIFPATIFMNICKLILHESQNDSFDPACIDAATRVSFIFDKKKFNPL